MDDKKRQDWLHRPASTIVYCVKNESNGEIVHTDFKTDSCIELANKLNCGKRGEERVFKVRSFTQVVSWDEYDYEEFLDEEEILEEFKKGKR